MSTTTRDDQEPPQPPRRRRGWQDQPEPDEPDPFGLGPITRLTGPEHLAVADELLTGTRGWPKRIPDRIAAAAVHVAAAQVQLQAFVELGELMDPGTREALVRHWFRVLPAPAPTDGIDEITAEWAETTEQEGPHED